MSWDQQDDGYPPDTNVGEGFCDSASERSARREIDALRAELAKAREALERAEAERDGVPGMDELNAKLADHDEWLRCQRMMRVAVAPVNVEGVGDLLREMRNLCSAGLQVEQDRDALAAQANALREWGREASDFLDELWRAFPHESATWFGSNALLDKWKALAATPEQSLAEHDERVREAALREAEHRGCVVCGAWLDYEPADHCEDCAIGYREALERKSADAARPQEGESR